MITGGDFLGPPTNRGPIPGQIRSLWENAKRSAHITQIPLCFRYIQDVSEVLHLRSLYSFRDRSGVDSSSQRAFKCLIIKILCPDNVDNKVLAIRSPYYENKLRNTCLHFFAVTRVCS